MNNYFPNNPDPLLQQQPYAVPYGTQPSQPMHDWIGDLDAQMKNLDPCVVTQLSQNSEFAELNASVQAAIQEEIVNLVKGRLNTYPNVVNGIKQMTEIIKRVSEKAKADERRSM